MLKNYPLIHLYNDFIVPGNEEEVIKAGSEACKRFPLDDQIHQTVGNSLGIVGNIQVTARVFWTSQPTYNLVNNQQT